MEYFLGIQESERINVPKGVVNAPFLTINM
jgi:hypothetical protein